MMTGQIQLCYQEKLNEPRGETALSHTILKIYSANSAKTEKLPTYEIQTSLEQTV